MKNESVDKPLKDVSKNHLKKRGRPSKVDGDIIKKEVEFKTSKTTKKAIKNSDKKSNKKVAILNLEYNSDNKDITNDVDKGSSNGDEDSDSDDITVEMLINNRFIPHSQSKSDRPVLRSRLVPLKPMPEGSDGESVVSHPSTDSDESRHSYQPQLVPRMDPYAPIVVQPKKKLTDPDQVEKLEKLSDKENVQPKDIINAIDKLREDVYQLQLRHQMLNIMLDMHQNLIDGLEYNMEHNEDSNEESSDEDNVTYHPAGLFGQQEGQTPFRCQPSFPARGGGGFQQASNILEKCQRFQGNNWLKGLTSAINKTNVAEEDDSDDK